jgi:hypothetical protein
VVVRLVWGRRWFLGEAESEVIDGDDPVPGSEASDEVPIEERPRRGAVDKHDWCARSLVDVVHPAVDGIEVAAGERVQRPIQPAGGLRRDV